MRPLTRTMFGGSRDAGCRYVVCYRASWSWYCTDFSTSSKNDAIFWNTSRWWGQSCSQANCGLSTDSTGWGFVSRPEKALWSPHRHFGAAMRLEIEPEEQHASPHGHTTGRHRRQTRRYPQASNPLDRGSTSHFPWVRRWVVSLRTR